MESLEFEFVRDRRLGFLDLTSPLISPRRSRPLSKLQMLKREVRRLDPISLAVFTGWLYRYDSTAWERRVRREERAAVFKKKRTNVDEGFC